MESKNNWKAWLYLAPVIVLMAVFTLYPIVNTVVVSFLKDYSQINGSSKGFTFYNYQQILSPGGLFYEDVWLTALPNTLILTLITVPTSIILALFIAIGLNSIPFLKKIFQTVFFMPYVTNAIAIGMVFSVIFDTQTGIFNAIFGTYGFPWIFPVPGGATVAYGSALFSICFYIVCHSLPYKILIFLGGLQNVDQQYYDAAKIDAASRAKTIMKITVPLLSPQILYVMITSFIGAFKEYNSVIGLFGTNGGAFDKNTGPSSMKTMVFFIYDQIAKGKVQYASAAAVILFVIIMLFTAIQFKVSKKRVHY